MSSKIILLKLYPHHSGDNELKLNTDNAKLSELFVSTPNWWNNFNAIPIYVSILDIFKFFVILLKEEHTKTWSVSWPNPKQCPMIHISDLAMIMRWSMLSARGAPANYWTNGWLHPGLYMLTQCQTAHIGQFNKDSWKNWGSLWNKKIHQKSKINPNLANSL